MLYLYLGFLLAAMGGFMATGHYWLRIHEKTQHPGDLAAAVGAICVAAVCGMLLYFL